MPATGAAFAADTNICSAQSELRVLGRTGPILNNATEMVFLFRNQEALGAFGCFYSL